MGLAAVELAAHAGCNVIAATGSPEKAEIALAAGAAAAVSYGDDPRAFREHVKELAPTWRDRRRRGHGRRRSGICNCAVEAFDGRCASWVDGLDGNQRRGQYRVDGVRRPKFDFHRCVVVGFGDIPKVPANLLLVKNCALVGLYWGAHAKARPDAFRKSLDVAHQSSMWADGLVIPSRPRAASARGQRRRRGFSGPQVDREIADNGRPQANT